MDRLSHSEAKSIFARYAEKDGFISISPENIAVEEKIGYDTRNEYVQSLYECMYFYDIEFRDDRQIAWKFSD